MPKKSPQISIDSRNRLVITNLFTETVKTPWSSYKTIVTESRGKRRLERIVLDGRWSLTPDHDLKFHVLGTNSQASGKTIILGGDLERIGPTSLGFRVRLSDNISGLSSNTVQLTGKWRADSYNRLTFNVAKSRGSYDILRFRAAWKLNKSNEIVYKYEKTLYVTKRKIERTLIFKGYWQLRKDRIVYSFEGTNASFFAFRAALQSRSLRASDGKIKYQIGIGYSSQKVYKRTRETITIYGKWKLNRDFSVGFEAEYSGRKKHELKFLVEKLIGESGKFTVSLKGVKGELPEFDVTFTKVFTSDAELFLALSKRAEETRIVGGVRVKF
ncbi:MAG: hypothetical protein HQ594_07560 [Candidatus Omnitrophica bacterium]|nr:hypothetical protein [Candidatus Omnitrophota bacterium]